MDPADVRVIIATVPPDDADALAHSLLERRLIACANVVPGIRSHYWWEGTIEHGEESLLVVKAPRALADRVVDAIRERHRYENPEVLVLPVEGGSEAYARWVGREATGRPDDGPS